MPRPKQLDDANWLAKRYASASGETIARELGCAPSTVVKALHRHGIPVRSRHDRQRNTPARLYDAEWLRGQYDAGRTPSQIAAELGVSRPQVYKLMRRLGIETDGPWVRRNTRRPKRPAKRRLDQLWKRHGTTKGVAAELEVAPTTAAVWLADVRIFVNDVPAISRADLERHIAAGHSIAEIVSAHRVTDRTVMIELRRHGLVEAHRRRPNVRGRAMIVRDSGDIRRS